MPNSEVKLPCVKNMGHLVPFCGVSSGTNLGRHGQEGGFGVIQRYGESKITAELHWDIFPWLPPWEIMNFKYHTSIINAILLNYIEIFHRLTIDEFLQKLCGTILMIHWNNLRLHIHLHLHISIHISQFEIDVCIFNYAKIFKTKRIINLIYIYIL